MRVLFLVTVFFLPGLWSKVAWADNALQRDIEKAIQPFVEHHMFSGAVLVAKQGTIVYQAGHGFANREWGIKNTPQAKFGLGSITKTITALLVMKLAQEKKLKLTNSVRAYLPELPQQPFAQITLHHLLSHTSGMANYFALPGWLQGQYRRTIAPAEFIKLLTQLPLLASPGERYFYSNSGYYLLGAVVERVTGKPYIAALTESILKPLNMLNTGQQQSTAILPQRVAGYRWAATGFKNQPYMNVALFQAAADLYSNLSDLYQLDQALYGDALLNAASKKRLFAPENSYGWSSNRLRLSETLEVDTQAYAGQLQGFSSMLTRFPKHRHCIIILSNTGTSFFERQRMMQKIAAVLYNLPANSTKNAAALSLSKALAEGKLEAAIQHIQQHPKQYQIEEARIDALATQLIWSGESELAIKVLTLNTRLFTESPRAKARLLEVKGRD